MAIQARRTRLTPSRSALLRPESVPMCSPERARLAWRSNPPRRRFWVYALIDEAGLSRRGCGLAGRRRQGVKMSVLLTRDLVNLFDVDLGEPAAGKEKPERKRDGVEEAAQLGRNERQRRADGGGLPECDDILSCGF